MRHRLEKQAIQKFCLLSFPHSEYDASRDQEVTVSGVRSAGVQACKKQAEMKLHRGIQVKRNGKKWPRMIGEHEKTKPLHMGAASFLWGQYLK